jgi:DNA-nicking Smr family endonuclease
MPTAREACRRLRLAVSAERKRGVKVLKIIHGYGSSGKGGRIREEVRKLLERMVGQGEVTGFLPGEDFRRQSGEARNLVRRFPELKEDSDFGRGNQGVTLVVLS